MPVITPHCANLFQEHKDFYQFLLTCQQTSIQKKCTQFVSLSLEIKAVDPLTVLHAIHQSGKRHFYFEKGSQDALFYPAFLRQGSIGNPTALAAWDTTAELQVEGPQRFSQAKAFIDSCLANTISSGSLHLPFAGPHFFCSFTFFDQSAKESPFPAASIFLPRWQVARQRNHGVAVTNLAISPTVNLEMLSQNVWHEFQIIQRLQNASLTLAENRKVFEKCDVAPANSFKNAVLSGLKSIQTNQFHKIVLAHAVDVTSAAPFDLFHSLNNLRKLHPDCYIFSTSNGQGKTFIGASPERLLRIHNQELATDALAGSAPRGRTALEDAYFANGLLSSEKERREHRVVIDFITHCLAKLEIMPQRSPLPYLLQLPNIQHLRTPIHAKVPMNLHLLEILAALHPTPAVAGAPTEVVVEQIRRYEAFERDLYAAPLGWVDYQGNGEFAVGIRSALIDGRHARLYAGAGIVAGSDPDKELAEINLKLQALLAALA
ncbi:MAG TPA: isochorismate synthase [Candidatus Caenarcaniphilales bacterium]